jgi:hypothetical protein
LSAPVPPLRLSETVSVVPVPVLSEPIVAEKVSLPEPAVKASTPVVSVKVCVSKSLIYNMFYPLKCNERRMIDESCGNTKRSLIIHTSIRK